MGRARIWSEEELNYLEENWGSISIKGIAKKLGRSVNAVKVKAYRIGLGDPRFQFDGLTLNQLSIALNISYKTIKNWINLYNFPAKRKLFAQKDRVLVVSYEDFWEWAENNKQMIDFYKVEKNILGVEPDWVEAKRNADYIRQRKIKKSQNHHWTTEEDATLKSMLGAFKYTYPEISRKLKRSEGAIKRRIKDLGLMARPVRRNNHIKYTEEDIKTMVELYKKGHCLEDIASRLDKSALGVRGKFERMGYRFKNGVPVKEKQIS